jgi:hypothetical protein
LMAMLGVGHADELVVEFLQTPLPKGTVLHRALYHSRRLQELNGHSSLPIRYIRQTAAAHT